MPVLADPDENLGPLYVAKGLTRINTGFGFEKPNSPMGSFASNGQIESDNNDTSSFLDSEPYSVTTRLGIHIPPSPSRLPVI